MLKKNIYILPEIHKVRLVMASYTLMLLRHALFENIAKIFAKMFAKMTNELNANKKSI